MLSNFLLILSIVVGFVVLMNTDTIVNFAGNVYLALFLALSAVIIPAMAAAYFFGGEHA